MPYMLPWDPWRELREVRDAMEKAFSKLPKLFDREQFGAWIPAVDVYEKDDEVIVKADLPGVNKKNVRILVSNEEVTIQGETKREEEVKEKNFYRSERVYGSFSRTIPLPVPVEREKAKASFKDGVLQIVVPKAKGAREDQVEIRPE
ncbi:MAG: Hsp20/alpha crystallin family protein [Thermoanaerobacteraceae bacterium]|nr:Hsp20/alpha crystallin family protein [Thermoanaerobacteraceae bacterium]